MASPEPAGHVRDRVAGREPAHAAALVAAATIVNSTARISE
jgi:hypothetical protein